MADLVVNARISIPDSELAEAFIRASGPGGQNVNKVSSAVQLRFDLVRSPSLSWDVKARATVLAGSRLTKDGVLIITAQTHRNQDDNRREARERLAELIREACVVPKKRWATKPTRASKEKRLEGKETPPPNAIAGYGMTIDPNKLRFALWGASGAFLVAALLSLSAGIVAIWWAFIIAIILAGAYGVTAPKNADGSLVGRDAVDPLDVLFSPLARQGFEQLPDPVMLLDVSSRVLFANGPMRGLVGPDPRGKHVSTLLRMPSVLDAVARANEGETATDEFTVPVPVERHYQIHATQLSVLPRVTLLLLHDLTTVRRIERMRADFIANASHELRTPLAAVSGFIDTLKGHARNDAEARDKFLDIMSVESARMRRLIDDLLSLTRIELNEHVPPSGETRVQNVLREAVAALMPLAEAENISIEIRAAEDLPPVRGQRDEIMQLFQNLTHNAIKYGKPDGHVWIEAEQISPEHASVPMLKISVRDDGEGIPASAIPRLTERFYRVDVKRSREKGGTGLGLAIVKHIVSRHHGRLQIESEAGEGSIFTVFLPLSHTPPAVI